MNEERELTLRDYGRVVWRRKWIVVAAVVTALAGALAMSFLQDPIYEAEAQMLVEPRSGEAVFQQDPQLTVANLERAIQTEIRVLEGQRVRERVQEDLGLDALPPEVDASPVGSTDVVVGQSAQRGPADRPDPRRRLRRRLHLDAAGAGGRQPRGGRGAAAGDGRRACRRRSTPFRPTPPSATR